MTRREIQRAARKLAFDYGAQLGYTMDIADVAHEYELTSDATEEELYDIEQYYLYTMGRIRRLLVL